MEETNIDRLTKMREEKGNKFEMILKEITNNKSESTATNPRSKTNEIQDTKQSGSKVNKSIGVPASNNGNSDSENDDFPRFKNERPKTSCKTFIPK